MRLRTTRPSRMEIDFQGALKKAHFLPLASLAKTNTTSLNNDIFWLSSRPVLFFLWILLFLFVSSQRPLSVGMISQLSGSLNSHLRAHTLTVYNTCTLLMAKKHKTEYSTKLSLAERERETYLIEKYIFVRWTKFYVDIYLTCHVMLIHAKAASHPFLQKAMFELCAIPTLLLFIC